MTRFHCRHLAGLFMALVLAACAVAPPQATVQVFTPAMQVPPGTTYRHERLPSQAFRPDQAILEGVADTWLARAGLRRDDANPRMAVQATVSQEAVAYGSGPSWMSVGVGGGSWSGGGVGLGLNFPVGGTAAYPLLRVDVQVRDLGSGQVVFQVQASSTSGANPAVLLDAALRDFPNMPPGTRVVPLPTGY